MSDTAYLQVVNISKRFCDSIQAVCDVSFSSDRGELIALVGQSGCGKTTTLKCINRLHELCQGDIYIDGKNIQQYDPVKLRREIGWVMQSDGLFEHLTVGENISIVPCLLGWVKSQINARIEELLTLVRLEPGRYLHKFPRELSGGQRQRVGVARALAARANLVLMDEPFGALDPITRDELREDILALKNKLGFAAVLVTHDMAEALLLADRIAVMHGGEIIQYGSPELLLNKPADSRVARMMGSPVREADRVNKLRQSFVGEKAH